MENRIKEVLANVLGIKASEVNESTSPDTVKQWDSLKQISLILALEEEFGVTFEDDQIAGMRSYTAIKNVVLNSAD